MVNSHPARPKAQRRDRIDGITNEEGALWSIMGYLDLRILIWGGGWFWLRPLLPISDHYFSRRPPTGRSLIYLVWLRFVANNTSRGCPSFDFTASQ
jgi:hypothetical protein